MDIFTCGVSGHPSFTMQLAYQNHLQESKCAIVNSLVSTSAMATTTTTRNPFEQKTRFHHHQRSASCCVYLLERKFDGSQHNGLDDITIGVYDTEKAATDAKDLYLKYWINRRWWPVKETTTEAREKDDTNVTVVTSRNLIVQSFRPRRSLPAGQKDITVIFKRWSQFGDGWRQVTDIRAGCDASKHEVWMEQEQRATPLDECEWLECHEYGMNVVNVNAGIRTVVSD